MADIGPICNINIRTAYFFIHLQDFCSYMFRINQCNNLIWQMSNSQTNKWIQSDPQRLFVLLQIPFNPSDNSVCASMCHPVCLDSTASHQWLSDWCGSIRDNIHCNAAHASVSESLWCTAGLGSIQTEWLCHRPLTSKAVVALHYQQTCC